MKNEKLKRIKVFISYCHKDLEWVKEDTKESLIPYLQNFFRDETEFWYDPELGLKHIGEEYTKIIETNIKESKFVILLLSNNFISSVFIEKVEIPLIKKLFDESKIQIIPILIKPVNFSKHESFKWLLDLQILPSKDNPLIDFIDKQAVWEKYKTSLTESLQNKFKLQATQEVKKEKRKKISMLISSTFNDTKQERRILQKEAILIKHDHVEEHFNMGVALYNEGQLDWAIREWQEAIRIKPDYVEAHFNMGIALQAKGQIDDAIEEFQEVIRINPDYVEAHFNMGIALYAIGKQNDAIEEFQVAIRIKPDYVEAHFNMVVVLQAIGQLDDSIKEFQKAILLKDDFKKESELNYQTNSNIQDKKGTPDFPGSKIDCVHFSITSPPSVLPGAMFVIDIWAHLEQQRQQVLERAREEARGAEIQIKSKGPIKVARGTILTVSLQVAELSVEQSEDTIFWEGEIGNATFALTVPKSASNGAKHGIARIRVEGLEVARLNFIIRIGSQSFTPDTLPVQELRHRTAFVSYASEDGDAVLARIQGMQKVMPSLNVFFAEAELRSGEYWQKRLKQEILQRDIMYLFWSEAASRSKWVEWEWKCGYNERGIDFIDPCPLVSPDIVPPPKELGNQLHFNDWVLAYMRNKKNNS